LARVLARFGPSTVRFPKTILAATAVVVTVSVIGITRIQINDNPVRWFRPNHPIRVADRVLNEHFGGTYNAFLVLTDEVSASDRLDEVDGTVRALLEEAASAGAPDLRPDWRELIETVRGEAGDGQVDELVEGVFLRLDAASAEGNEAVAELWDEILVVLEAAQTGGQPFKSPEALGYMEGLEADLLRSGLVGKSNSLSDIVRTVHRELRGGDPSFFTIPPSAGGVAQTLLTYQSSHRPDDLWHFVTPDYRSANIWLQLKSGDNRDMTRVTERVAAYMAENSPPPGVTVGWAGLTYLNVVWQKAMVNGMLQALLGSFIIVFIMMVILFRSFWFGALAMLPLSITITFIYGLIGLAGKDYDMPVAVLSALTLGLSVDFAIHFLQRARALQRETGSWRDTVERMFSEPARAITRNAIVIAVGFLPLLGSALTPYNTVGFFLAAIMAVSCIVTLLLLPAVMEFLTPRLFPEDAALPAAGHPGGGSA
jgi:predicted RND superfamily exporter protein